MTKKHRNAFTLIEVLIVVVIMAILAAVIIPQFTASTDDAKESSTAFNAHVLRSQLELYKIHHGSYPADLNMLTIATDKDGNPGGQYGPYIDQIPVEPTTGSNGVNTAASKPAAPVAGDVGWVYIPTTGEIYPNTTEGLQ
ncbi:MAG: type II secretion system protein [Planctomycetota bacterium]|nr:MAG: type II secretion system protein [Planctomycetota bacterium]